MLTTFRQRELRDGIKLKTISFPVPAISIVPQIQYIGRFTDYLYDNNGYPIGDGLADPGVEVSQYSRNLIWMVRTGRDRAWPTA